MEPQSVPEPLFQRTYIKETMKDISVHADDGIHSKNPENSAAAILVAAPTFLAVPTTSQSSSDEAATATANTRANDNEYYSVASRDWRNTIHASDRDFLSIPTWLQFSSTPIIPSKAPNTASAAVATTNASVSLPTNRNPAAAAFSSCLSELDRSEYRRVLLLTLPYHSSPYSLLQQILEQLRTDPPPPQPNVFASTDSDEDDLGAPVSPRSISKRPTRSADVVINPTATAGTVPPHHKRQTSLQPTVDDPLIMSLSPTISSNSSSATPTSPSISVGTSASAASSVASSNTEPTITQIASPTLVADQKSPAVSPLSISPMSPVSSSPQLTVPVVSQTTTNTKRAGLRPTNYSMWHARKLHLLSLLHEWVRDYPQDFCCAPLVSQSTSASTTESSSLEKKKLLEELLVQEMQAFPPASWNAMASANNVNVVSDSNTKDSDCTTQLATNRFQANTLTPATLQAFRAVAAALVQQYERSRERYRMEELVPLPTSLSSSSFQFSPVEGTSPSGVTSPISPLQLPATSPSASLSPLNFLPAPAVVASTPRRSNAWNRNWGSTHSSLEKNLANEKIKRMLQVSATGVPSPAGPAAVSPNQPANRKVLTERRKNNNSSENPMGAAVGPTSPRGAAAATSPVSSCASLSVQVSPTHSASFAAAASQAACIRFTNEFLSTPSRSYAMALTWLAIQRVQEIGECNLQNDAAASLSATAAATASPLAAAATPTRYTFHQPASLCSPSFLRLFLSMPAALAKRQMKMSNTMSCFVATSILLAPNVEKRKQVIQHWIEIACECLAGSPQVLHSGSEGGFVAPSSGSSSAANPPPFTNFMHAFEIIYGINHQSVYRLPAIQYGFDGKQMRSGGSIFASVSTSSSQTVLPLLHKRNFLSHHAYNSYTRLTKLTSPSQNYKEYRKAISEIQEAELQRMPGDKTPPRFHVPYLGILLKDLVGMEEAGKPLAGLSSLHPNQLAALHHSLSNVDSRLAELDDPATTNVYQVQEADENAEENEDDDDDDNDDGDENSVVLGDSVPVGSSMIEEEDDTLLQRESRSSVSSASAHTNSISNTTEENRDPNSSNGDTLNFVTGSLPWDDSFLARPRRNARVDDELDLFSSQTTIPSSNPSTPGDSDSKSKLRASLSPSEDKKADLLTMLLTVDEAAFDPSPIKVASNSPVSLLSAALPTRHAKSRPSSKRASQIQTGSSPQDALGSKRLSRIAVGGGGGEVSHRVLNRPKLCKIASIVETALRCRFSFPTLPNEEDDDVVMSAADLGKRKKKSSSRDGALPTTPTRGRGLTAAFATRATEQAEEQKQFMRVVAAAALDTPALVDPSLSVSETGIPTIATPTSSSSVSELAFDRRVQHWLLSSMMTVTLKEEQQLMDKSYVIYPRKNPNSGNM